MDKLVLIQFHIPSRQFQVRFKGVHVESHIGVNLCGYFAGRAENSGEVGDLRHGCHESGELAIHPFHVDVGEVEVEHKTHILDIAGRISDLSGGPGE